MWVEQIYVTSVSGKPHHQGHQTVTKTYLHLEVTQMMLVPSRVGSVRGGEGEREGRVECERLRSCK